MTKFRKLPVVIEARQLTTDNGHFLINWMLDSDPSCATIFNDDLVTLNIQTLGGWHKADIGDWIIKGVKGEFYPCKPDIFEATYEEVIGEDHGN